MRILIAEVRAGCLKLGHATLVTVTSCIEEDAEKGDVDHFLINLQNDVQ